MTEQSFLQGKQIVVGVTGSIAAYKSADLIRRLCDCGAEIRVVMTRAACEFITPLTLQSLSGHPVAVELLDADHESAMGHIALARWADWVLVAPASADFIARLVHGRADDLLTTLILASESPLVVAPAMNNRMWQHPATKHNLTLLKQRDVQVIDPASGELACGEYGEGRLVEPVDIVRKLADLAAPGQLNGRQMLITAGPTWESIDPVRFIANRSSGKMGFALAMAARQAGATVTLVCGPVSLATPTGVERIDVENAQQMYEVVCERIDKMDIFIACAAVADFRPKVTASQKIKKRQLTELTLELEATPDIVTAVTKKKKKGLFIVGFAAETDKLANYAKDKLQQKGVDMIASNQVGDSMAFAADDNALEVFWSHQHRSLPLASKQDLATDLMTLITEQFYAKNSTENS